MSNSRTTVTQKPITRVKQLRQKLIEDVQTCSSATGISETSICRKGGGNTRTWEQLTGAGDGPTIATIDRIYDYMAGMGFDFNI